MNYSGNMPDWHQYNTPQSIGSEVPSIGQNVTHSPIFGTNISPRRLNGPNFSPDGLHKSQNDANFNPRNFQQSPHTVNAQNVQPENSPMAAVAPMSACHSHYGTPSPRNTMIDALNTSLDSRNVPSSGLNKPMGQRHHQIPMNGPTAQLSCPTIGGSMGQMGQRNVPTTLHGPVPSSSRQGPASYVSCKGPCCNPDTNTTYQCWEKYGPYPPNVPYRDTGYSVDNRRFANDFNLRKDGFENREQLACANYNMDPRRNLPDYKYRKESIVPRGYAHPPAVLQSYPVQNYNFAGDYQKYPAYPIKEYSRESSVTNPQNPAVLKYQEQSVIVQQKYFTKQIQYQNGIIPKSLVPANVGGNIISRTQNPYFNPQLARDFPRDYTESSPLPNRGIQTTASPIHATYPKYQMYQQKIAMQRFSMENHLRELTRIPGYQSHPKYQEGILRYRELLRLQQTVDYQSTVQDSPRLVSSQVNEEIPPISLQFDQNGVLINTSFSSSGFSSVQGPINVQTPTNLQTVSDPGERQKMQQTEHFKAELNIGNQIHIQDLTSLSQNKLSRENAGYYSIDKEFDQDQFRAQKYESEGVNLDTSEEHKTLPLDHRNSKDFADKPELDVRQFLANWDESEDEEGANSNLPDVVLSNATPVVVVEYENTKLVSETSNELENCSVTEDCRSADTCENAFENTQSETKSLNCMDTNSYKCDVLPNSGSPKSLEQDLDISESFQNGVRTGTVIQSTSCDYGNEKTPNVIESSANAQDDHESAKLTRQAPKSPNNNQHEETTNFLNADISVKKEFSPKTETSVSINEHMETYEYKPDPKLCSSIENTIENDDDDSRSSSDKDSSDDTQRDFGSNEHLSELDDSDSMTSNSVSSFINSPKIIKGTEIHVDAQELSSTAVMPKSDSAMLDSPNLQKQNSFASEESHNQDDISLPDLPTSECTPISTTLNTPIHSDSEESSDPVIDLTIPTNPIEIIQNSPMLSFTHSPIKMEPYENLDESDLTDKKSHDALNFDFPKSNSCDDEFEKQSAETTEQYNSVQNDQDSCDSDCVVISSEDGKQNIENDMSNIKTDNNVITNVVEKDDLANGKRFSFNEGNVIETDKVISPIVDVNHQPWPLVTDTEYRHELANNTDHPKAKSDNDKSGGLSDLSVTSQVTQNHLKDNMAHTSSAKNSHDVSKWQLKNEVQHRKRESSCNVTALNLVKNDNTMQSDSLKIAGGTMNSREVENTTRYPFSTNRGTHFTYPNQDVCDFSMESQGIIPSTKQPELYSSSSEEDQIYKESVETQPTFTGSSNIPLIPGEDFEEPKMPVLPMEGNCLTKIIKNTSPIIDLDVLDSDDEKLDKIEEIWMEVGDVETVDKPTDLNIDGFTASVESYSQEKSLSSQNNLRKLHKNQQGRVKNSVKPTDTIKLSETNWNNSKERDLKNTDGESVQFNKPSSPDVMCGETGPIDGELQDPIISGVNDTTGILPEKVNITSTVIVNSSVCEDGNSSRNIFSESNTTEIIKCKEKTNHINDIATKLLENARLFEPELRKMETLRKESSCSENSSDRDSSKKRIKLLKEFRKVKNKTNINRYAIHSTKSMDDVRNNTETSVQIAKECTKMDSEKQRVKIDDKIVENENIIEDTIDKVSHTSDSPMTNFKSTDHQVIKQINVNIDQNVPCINSPNIVMAEDKQGPKLDCNAESIETEDMLNKNSDINMGYDVTIKDSSSVNHHIVEENINDSAINLSKSSNCFGILPGLHDEDHVQNHKYKSSISNCVKIMEPAEMNDKITNKKNSTESAEHSSISSDTVCKEDYTLCTEMVDENDKTLETNQAGLQNFVEDNCKFNSVSTCTNLVEKRTIDGDCIEKIELQLTTAADYEKPKNVSSNPEETTDLVETSKSMGKMHNEAKSILEQSQLTALNNSADVDDEDDQQVINLVQDKEIPSRLENVEANLVSISAMNDEESTNALDNFHVTRTKSLLNQAQETETSIEATECGECSLQSVENVSEKECIKSPVRCNQVESVPAEVQSITKLSGSKHSIEIEPIIANDCSLYADTSCKDLKMESDVCKESSNVTTMCKDIDGSKKYSTLYESLVRTRLEESAKPEYLQNTNLDNIDLPSGTNRSSNTVDENLDAFGIENSFNCDFNNFDVAPNISDTADNDQSSSWKYSKAYARFEDCERYKNPDNFLDPTLTSLETLDNLNTVPVYTTKDGKITYSPNPKFTYRALIMEARKREGYPAIRKSYCGNAHTPEFSHYSRTPTSLRKRKNAEGCNFSETYSKKNYWKNYELREHGESSMKHQTEQWNRGNYCQKKYHNEPRDKNIYNLTPNNGDADKRYKPDRITQEKSSTKYKYRDDSEERTKRKNGSLNNFKKQCDRSTERSSSDSVWSKSRAEWDQTPITDARRNVDIKITTYNTLDKNLENTISTRRYSWDLKNDNQSEDLCTIGKFGSLLNEATSTNECAMTMLPQILQCVEFNTSNAIVEEFQATPLELDNKITNEEQLGIQKTAVNVDFELFNSEREISESPIVERKNSLEMVIQTDPVKFNVVSNRKISLEELNDKSDDMCDTKTLVPNNAEADTCLPYNESKITLNSPESLDINKSLEVCHDDVEKFNIENNKKSTVSNAETQSPSFSSLVQIIDGGNDSDVENISKIRDTNELANSLDEKTENSGGENKCEKFQSSDEQMTSNYSANCILEVEDIHHGNLSEGETHEDKHNKLEVFDHINQGQVDLDGLKSRSGTIPHLEDSCCIQSLQKTTRIERKEPKNKYNKIKTDNKNGTMKVNQPADSNDNVSLKTPFEYENISKHQLQFENYIAYSPSNENPEDTKGIPKLVIKKADSLNCRSSSSDLSAIASHDVCAKEVLDKDEPGCKISTHPKIPKILIRNAKSRPSTPSVEEISEKTVFSVSTKADTKIPKVTIRFEERILKSSTVSSIENATESKIPKMKIKLEDKLPKVIMETINTETYQSNEDTPKIIPKMKIKNLNGTLTQIVDAQPEILPVSIPRMLISTETDRQEINTQVLKRTDASTSDKNVECSSVIPDSVLKDQKTTTVKDLKKIPKLKIKRQSSGCSVELNRKRHSVSPIQSELKKVKKSLKLTEGNDKKQSNKISLASEHEDGLKKLDGFNLQQSYELASTDNIEYITTVQSEETVVKLNVVQMKSTTESGTESPQEIPKVIIKRASPSAEFKCELSKGRRDAIIKNTRWQPQVKLHRSWVLDCMAKDFDLDKLRLKLVTPDSILKKRLMKKKPEFGEVHEKGENVHTYQNKVFKKKKLFRSKSTSDLLPVYTGIGTINSTNITEPPRELITRKRCKSDLGNTFSNCKKELRDNNSLIKVKLMSTKLLKPEETLEKCWNTQTAKESDIEINTHLEFNNSKKNIEQLDTLENYDDIVNFMETSKGNDADRILDENMNSKSEISTIEHNQLDKFQLNNDTLTKSFVNSDLSTKILSDRASSAKELTCNCECYENTEKLRNNFDTHELHSGDESGLNYSPTTQTNKFPVLKDSLVSKTITIHSVEQHANSMEKQTKDVIDHCIQEDSKADCTLGEIRMFVNNDVSLNKADAAISDSHMPKNVAILEATITRQPDSTTSTNNCETCCNQESLDFSSTSNAVPNPKNANCQNIHKSDVKNNSDADLKETDEDSADLMLRNTVAKQENNSISCANLPCKSVVNDYEVEELVTGDIRNPSHDVNLVNSLDHTIHSVENSIIDVGSFEERQTIIDILSASPRSCHNEIQIQSSYDGNESHGMCIYHEDAIPTQFELELEIPENTMSDSLEIPTPQIDYSTENLQICSTEEPSIISNGSVDIVTCEITFPNKNEANSSETCSITSHRNKGDIILSKDIDKQDTNSSTYIINGAEPDTNEKKLFCYSDMLVKEVLAAKETLRKCLSRSKNESRFKLKVRPKTAAEKKQGSSFDPSSLGNYKESFTKTENHSSMNYIDEADSSQRTNRKIERMTSNNEKLFLNQSKTELKVTTIKSERKHSKASRNNLLQMKYSSFPSNLQEYASLAELGGCIIPKHSTIGIEENIEFTKSKTISLKNSKYLIKNTSYSDERKELPELINSKDNKCRSKSSRHDINSKYVHKSKSTYSNTEVRESSANFDRSEDKSVSDVTKYDYKSLKSSSDQNANLMISKTKFKSYKIPRITKSNHRENDRLTKELHESQSREARMPILEPQINLSADLEVSELNSDREMSRSPPLITNQESRREITNQVSNQLSSKNQCQISLDKDQEILSSQRITSPDKEVLEVVPSRCKETTVVDIVNDMAYHEKATIRHRRYCTLCERWFPTVARHRRHLSGYQHRHTELTQRRTIHALFTLFTGRQCPRLQPPGVVRIDCEPGELTPLQIAVQGITKESNKVDGNIRKPPRENKYEL